MKAKITVTALLAIALAIANASLWTALTSPAFAQEDGIGTQAPPPHHQPDPHCSGHIDYPHKSRHVSNTVNVVARTRCDIPVSIIQVTVILQKGSVCVLSSCLFWSNHGTPGVAVKSVAYLVSSNSAGRPCENGHYRGVGTHYVVGPQGVSETFTQSKRKITNC